MKIPGVKTNFIYDDHNVYTYFVNLVMAYNVLLSRKRLQKFESYDKINPIPAISRNFMRRKELLLIY